MAEIFRHGLADGTLLAGVPDEAADLDEPGALDEAVAEFMAIFDGMAAQAYLPGAGIGPAEARSRLHRYVDRLPR